ncbi:MAG: stage III sporulation protein AD [Clostridia bacterium]|nr:stage III sporulation protein AD [Clostridia bacterium]
MDIFKIILLGITVTILSVILKQYKPEFAVQISIAAGVIIFFAISDLLKDTYLFLENLTQSIGIDILYINILFKIIGISYLCEFASAICNDAGESAMAIKINIAGKVTLLYLSLPILEKLLTAISEVTL